MQEHLLREQGYIIPSSLRNEIQSAVLGLHVMPSMRALMTAGPALQKSHIAGYNCSYLPVCHTDAFHEALFILMHGTGVGFSVERQFTGGLPLHRCTRA
jgi:ribonucleoside-triphosphate reductase (thioredoxin)